MNAAYRETAAEPACVFERLQATNPEHEIWWDASPLVFANWRSDILEKTPALRQAMKTSQLKRLFDFDSPRLSIVRGATTNQAGALTWLWGSGSGCGCGCSELTLHGEPRGSHPERDLWLDGDFPSPHDNHRHTTSDDKQAGARDKEWHGRSDGVVGAGLPRAGRVAARIFKKPHVRCPE